MKRILATTAIATLAAMPVMAQTQTGTDSGSQATTQSGATGTQSGQMTVGSQSMSVDTLIGKSIYLPGGNADEVSMTDITDAPSDWENVGEISDVYIDKDGRVSNVVADIGGFVGVGEREVALDMQDLQFAEDQDDQGEYFVVYQGDRSALESSEEFDRTAMNEGGGRFISTEGNRQAMGQDGSMNQQGDNRQAMDQSGTGMDQSGTTGTTGGTMAQNDSGMGNDQGMTGSDRMAGTGNGMSDQSDSATGSDRMAQDGSDMTGDRSDTVVGDTGGAAGDGTLPSVTGDGAGTGEQDMAQGDDTMTGDRSATGNRDMAAGEGEDTGTSLTETERAALTADDLEGQPIMGPDGDRIGEIGELVVSNNGVIDQIIVDVGGFLGIGEKQVALPFNEVDISRTDAGDLRVNSVQTEDTLENMPAWEG